MKTPESRRLRADALHPHPASCWPAGGRLGPRHRGDSTRTRDGGARGLPNSPGHLHPDGFSERPHQLASPPAVQEAPLAPRPRQHLSFRVEPSCGESRDALQQTQTEKMWSAYAVGGDSAVRMNACVCIDTDGPGEVGGQFWRRPVVFCERRPSQGTRLLDSSVWPRGVAVRARELIFCGWSTFLPFGGGPPARRSGRHRRDLLRTFSRGHVVSLLSAFASSVQLGRCFHLGSESASTCSSEAGRCLPLLAARPALPHGPSLLSRIGPLRSGAADTRWPSHDHGVSRLLAPGLPLLPSVATIDDVSDH
ncbi:uncharacterized protein LOC132006420 [Mustela nigripes]|uniref:uncharacterized protein LOC132006420 n=1 Tax=Mustela nigripes TaxID=77151 RepID=UPI002814D5A3|nr:uncharacterized protein LOC132006420 [Mustela nigripes]